MNDVRPDHLSREDVARISSILKLEDGAFIVGGQALNLWAERYSQRVPELADFRPYTSKDIDYFGQAEAARKLAITLGGEVRYPSIGDATPCTAIVFVTLSGRRFVIDFIGDVLGIRRVDRLKRNVVQIEVSMHPENNINASDLLMIPVMHPVHCMISRIANVLSPALQRRDDVAMRQLRAAPLVVQAYIDEELENGEAREATDCLRDIHRYLKTDKIGRDAHKRLCIDPLHIIRAAATNSCFDKRYREITITRMIAEIERLRTRREANA